MTAPPGFLGADITALDQLAATMRGGGDTLTAISARLRTRSGELAWWGTDADTARADLGRLAETVTGTAAILAQVSAGLLRQAEQQRTASGDRFDSGAAIPGVGPAPGEPPPRSGGPVAAARWWAGLSPTQRAAAIAADPRSIGAMDGLPAAARDTANRAVLAADLKDVYLARESLAGSWISRIVDPGYAGRLAGMSARLRGLEAIERTLNTVPDCYLLGIGQQGDSGRLIIAVGNPDGATHTAVLVPGMTTNIDGSAEQIRRIEGIRSAVLAKDPAASVSAVLWLGYDAPPGLVSAMSAARADAATAPLDTFVAGLRASHVGDPGTITAVGHSYGTLVVGEAAASQGLDVNDIVFLGSPGVGVDSAAELGVGPDHVYAMTQPNDVIRLAPAPALLEAAALGLANPVTQPVAAAMIGDRLTDLEDPNLRFGTSPASPQFGATVWPGAPDPKGMKDAHSSYFDAGSPTLDDIAGVILGDPPKARHGASGSW